MNESELFTNFITQYRQPFDINVVMQVIGSDRSQAKALLKQATKQGKIKCIQQGCKPIWVRVNRYHVKTSTNSRNRWNTKPEVETQIRQLLAQKHYTSGRQLAKDLGKSHEYVYKYISDLRQQGHLSRRGRCFALGQPTTAVCTR